MSGLFVHMVVALRLHFRNRQALIYGYIFPLLFMLAFWIVYRNERVPLARHMGEILTIGMLGGACFGLPTTIVSERERGFWRRYRTAGVSPWLLLSGTIGARFLIMLTVGMLQLAAAKATGVPWPHDYPGFLLAFGLAAFAFLGLGLVIAMVANDAPAVQSIGQCLFLPMLVVGGVAVPFPSLPGWAQHLSGYFPGRYAVALLQDGFPVNPGASTAFHSLALLTMGLGGMIAAAFMFRWDAGEQSTWRRRTPLLLLVGFWTGVGLAQEALANPSLSYASRPNNTGPRSPSTWENINSRDVANLDYNALPPDFGVVVPFASDIQVPDANLVVELAAIERQLAQWPLAQLDDSIQAVRNQLAVLGVADVLQSPIEPYLPRIVLEQLSRKYPKADLIRMLTWIAAHPFEGTVFMKIEELGVPGEAGNEEEVRLRAQVYAIKMVARLSGRKY